MGYRVKVETITAGSLGLGIQRTTGLLEAYVLKNMQDYALYNGK